MSGLKNLQNVQLFKNKLAGKAPSLPSPSTNCTIISPFGETNKFDCYAGTTTSGLCYKEIAVLPLCKTSGGGGGDPTATTNSLSPTASSTASSSSSDTSSGSGSTVAIAVGASLGAVLLLSAIAAFAFFRLKASARRSAKDVTPVPSSDYHHHGGAPYPPSVQQQQPNAMFQHMSTYPSSSPSLPSYDVAGGRQPSMPLFEAAPAGSPLLGPASPAVPYPHYSQPPTTTISGAVATVGSENGNGGSNGDMFKGVNVPPKPENRKLGNTSHMGSSESLLLAPSSAFGSAPLEQDLGDHEDMFLPETPRG
ncbi:hypothetical protein BC828DRAFT_407403 [Blastocladiella britannica]|nr:hypothetical protein BC828DRAFT_407403 [Blastocladiella britannica]